METNTGAYSSRLALSMWRREVDCAKYEHKTERGLLPDFSQKLFNKDNINYKTSILYRHSAVASCHFPRLLGKARLYFLIVPLFNQRFREMFRQAQHDKKLLHKCR